MGAHNSKLDDVQPVQMAEVLNSCACSQEAPLCRAKTHSGDAEATAAQAEAAVVKQCMAAA